MENAFIGEERKLIFDVLEISESFYLKSYIVTVDTEKAFDALSYSFLVGCFKKTVIWKYLYTMGLNITWMPRVLQNILNFEKMLEKAISFHLPVCLSFEIVDLIQAYKSVKEINIFEPTYFYSA